MDREMEAGFLPVSPTIVDTTTAEFPARRRPDEPHVSSRDRQELGAIVHELVARQRESLRLYRPVPAGEGFHASRAGIRLARGSNRGGKTVTTAVELARAMTNQDPHGKYPAKGRVIVVGKDLMHCSKVVYRKLFKPGAFKIIRDAATAAWRVYVPDQDFARAAEAIEAPPLIPHRFYGPKSLSWENKREEVLRSATLFTGWEMTMFSGEGEPPQGWDVDLIYFDEEIGHPKWYPEMVPRMVDRGGRFIWSFTPQAGTVVAYELYERAVKERDRENPRVQDFLMTISDNPFISAEAKRQFHEDLEFDEEELKVRFYGDFALKGMRVYPELARTGSHRIEPFSVPEDWARYVAIDPGRRVAAALLLAVPPPGNPVLDRPVVYGEVYSKQSTAGRFAAELKAALGGAYVNGWIIDHMHGRKHSEDSGETIEELYARELRAAGMDQQGFSGFVWGSPDIAAGKLASKGKIAIREGAPGWYFMVANLPWFFWEAERYIDRRMTRGGNVVDDVSRSNLHNHLMDCFRYLAMHNCAYTPPPKRKSRQNWVVQTLERRRLQKARRSGWGGSIRLG